MRSPRKIVAEVTKKTGGTLASMTPKGVNRFSDHVMLTRHRA